MQRETNTSDTDTDSVLAARFSAGEGSVLVVDDDEFLNSHLRSELTERGFVATGATTAIDGVGQFDSLNPDVVILDLVLPDASGLDVLRRIRDQGSTPIIILSGLNTSADRVAGLELGADDYVNKPCPTSEIVARIRAVRRRVGAEPSLVGSSLQTGQLSLNNATLEAVLFNEPVPLRPREFALIYFLASRPRQVFTRAQLLEAVWHSEVGWQADSTVTEHVHRLRRNFSMPSIVESVRGAGYRFNPDAVS